ncbi:MAG: sigma factor-like helix-turn-helix DNA-binding protein [Candidatus Komeilibacteria bacterium]
MSENKDFTATSADSILDKVLSSQTAENIANFDPTSILHLLFSKLNERERQVIVHRYGLEEGEAKTLEEIGRLFNVTRERIRQIENSSIRKIKSHPEIEEKLKPVESLINSILEEYGGVMREDNLFDKILSYSGAKQISRTATNFIITHLLGHKLEKINKHSKLHDSWKLPSAELEIVEDLVDHLIEILHENKEPLARHYLLDALQRRAVKAKEQGMLNDSILDNILDLTTKIDSNPFDEWGLVDWRSITPKRMNDKIYLVMKKEGKPMHFNEIAEKINAAGFDKKKAYPATIHNELILDDKYVLVGRGIYALKEWGYHPGVVADVITEVLQEADEPLTKEEIIKRVLAKRIVKKSTIQLSLMNKDRFAKVGRNKYTLVEKK